MSDGNAFDEAIGAASPTTMRIDKLRDGGFVVGTTQFGTFATSDIDEALDYISERMTGLHQTEPKACKCDTAGAGRCPVCLTVPEKKSSTEGVY